LQTAEANGDQALIVKQCLAIADEHLANHNWPEAVAFLRRGLAAAESVPRQVTADDFNSLRIDLSLCYLNLGRHDVGIAVLGTDLQELDPAGNDQLKGTAYTLLARHFQQLGRRSEAIAQLVRARETFQAAGMTQKAVAIQKALESMQ
jgi:tetratricopeptide (TPR) repeat protein